MGQWVVTVAGIVILSVLCDVILPEGQTRKYIKTVVGVIVTLVMLQPIVSLASGSLNIEISQSANNSATQVQQSYLDMVNNKQIDLQLSTVKGMLEARDVPINDIKINSADKTILLQAACKRSDEKQDVISDVVKTYFVDYKITIEWK